MKSLKSIFVTGLFTVGIFTCVLYASCKNKCGSVVCQNGGTCSNNKCVCATGYYGSTCGTSESAQFIGTYTCTQTCTPSGTGPSSWISAVTVASSNGGYTVSISNFGGNNSSTEATVDSMGNIQIIPAAGTYGLTARGAYTTPTGSKGQIVLTYYLSTASGTLGYNCRMTMVKE